MIEMRRVRVAPALALLAALVGFAPEAHADWSKVLKETRSGYAGIDVSRDGTVGLFNHRAIVLPSGQVRNESIFRTRPGRSWSAPTRLEGGYPLYPASSYGPTVKNTFDHYVVAIPQPNPAGIKWVAGMRVRYSTSRLRGQGKLYTLLLRSFDGTAWSDWHRVITPGMVEDVSLDAAPDGRVFFAWRASDNITPGSVNLSSFDPATGAVGPVQDLGPAIERPITFQSVKTAVADNGDVWVTFRAPDGLVGRRLLKDGTLRDREMIVAGRSPPVHDSVFADGTLWVATNEPGIELYRWTGRSFKKGTVGSVFDAYSRDNGVELEGVSFDMPSITARPEGGIAVLATRSYHFETLVPPLRNRNTIAIASRERTAAATWTNVDETAYAPGSWNNTGGSAASGPSGIWACGIIGSGRLVVFRRRPGTIAAPLSLEDGLLEFLNAPSTTYDLLDRPVRDGGVGLRRDAAAKLVRHRDGTDGVSGTADDDPFDTLREVYDVLRTGPEALLLIEQHVSRVTTLDSVALDLANDPLTSTALLDDAVGLRRSAADNIVRYRDGGPDHLLGNADDRRRPFRWIFGQSGRQWSLDQVPYVGRSSIQKLHDYGLLRSP